MNSPTAPVESVHIIIAEDSLTQAEAALNTCWKATVIVSRRQPMAALPLNCQGVPASPRS